MAEQHAQGTATVLGWIDVALALGMPGKPYAGYGCLTGQGNGQGGREHGQKADQLPGYRMIDDTPRPRPRRRGVGRPAGLAPRARGDRPTSCSTPSEPTTARRRCSSTAPTSWSAHPTPPGSPAPGGPSTCIVVCDIVMSETAALADVVLPVTHWAEETAP
ncbi:hypothetical protein [Nocardioides kongjuensis]|uniref:hypothetical protein n=1 Tax=Nocardioides kongjuensis TaxID=349522 RepID=UPI0031EA46D9